MNFLRMKDAALLLFGVGLIVGCCNSNTAPRNKSPEIEITSPLNGALLARGDTVEILIDTSDEDGLISQVMFFIDSNLNYTDSDSPFVYYWNTSDESLGRHVIGVEVVDNDRAHTAQSLMVTLQWGYRQPEQASDGWETASLESVSMNEAPFVDLMNTLHHNEDHRVHGIVIVRHGKLVFEEYFAGLTHPTWSETPVTFDRERLHVLSSITKSFTATLLGIALQRGFISSADDCVFDYYPELVSLKTGLRQDLSLRHLVTMTSGLEWDESSLPLTDPDNDLTAFMQLARYTDEDIVAHILGRDMVAEPGAIYNYSGGNTNVLGNAIQRASGLRLDEFAQEYLFGPLGIEQSWWWLLRPDFVYASGDLALCPRDMARFGQLFLQNGFWNGEQIVSEEWVTNSATPSVLLPQPFGDGFRGYSHGWWPCIPAYGQEAYAAAGWGNQEIIVLPEHDMVVVFTGGAYWDPALMTPMQIMLGYILPSLQGN